MSGETWPKWYKYSDGSGVIERTFHNCCVVTPLVNRQQLWRDSWNADDYRQVETGELIPITADEADRILHVRCLRKDLPKPPEPPKPATRKITLYEWKCFDEGFGWDINWCELDPSDPAGARFPYDRAEKTGNERIIEVPV